MTTRAPDRASGAVRGYRDLLVWQHAMDLVVTIYHTTARFPKEERYALVDQLRRAAVSVPSNIAEGHGRSRTGDYLRHLSIAVGSLMELETQVQIAGRLGYVPEQDEKRLLESSTVLARMFAGLIRALRRRVTARTPDPRLQTPDS